MITLFSFLQISQMLLEHRCLRKCCTVNTAEHLILFIATPICTGALCQLKRLYALNLRDMRAGTKLNKFALLIKADFFAFCGVLFDKFYFVWLILFFHKLNCLIGRKLKAFYFRIFFYDVLHLFFDFFQIVGRK